MTTPKLDPKTLLKAKPEAPAKLEGPTEETLHHMMLEVLLIMSLNGGDISRESLSCALATRSNLRAKIWADLTCPPEPRRNKV